MTAPKSVLGVSGVCRVGFRYSTQFQTFIHAAFRLLCWVCWVCRRARAYVTLIALERSPIFFSYARTYKPNKPNTLNSKLIKILILKEFICVGSVLGLAIFVLGSFFRGEGQ